MAIIQGQRQLAQHLRGVLFRVMATLDDTIEQLTPCRNYHGQDKKIHVHRSTSGDRLFYSYIPKRYKNGDGLPQFLQSIYITLRGNCFLAARIFSNDSKL